MLIKLRTDLINKLSKIKLLLINADGFIKKDLISLYLNNPGMRNGHHIDTLRKVGIESVAFSHKTSIEISSIINRFGIEIFHQGVSKNLNFYSELKSGHSVLNENIAFFCWDHSDLDYMRNVNFAVAPADAPLEVKANSYYVTYGIGEEAVREISELIVRAKTILSDHS
jgi:YrbI family 3-deoxy-D-manno-octulosonate 8-phosphate phosphatase